MLLLLLWLCMLLQLCATKLSRRHKDRFYKMSILTLFSTLSVVLNALTYLTAMFPHFIFLAAIPLWRITYIAEAVTIIIGFHLYGLSQLSILNRIYTPIRLRPPQCIRRMLQTVEVAFIGTVLAFYAFVVVKHRVEWTQRLYALLTAIVLIESLVVVIALNRLLGMLRAAAAHSAELSELELDKLRAAQQRLRCAMFLGLSICVVCVVGLAISVEIAFAVIRIRTLSISAFLFQFQDCAMHSAILILLNAALFLWIFSVEHCRRDCCALRRGTVCDYCGCVDLVQCFCCVPDAQRSSDQDFVEHFNRMLRQPERFEALNDE